jgi:N-acetylmuramoyl-L-alanine amidase
MAAVVFACTLLFSASAQPKKIEVYSLAANYSLPVSEVNGQDYVGLLEILEPLGTVSATTDGSRWTLRYNGVQAEFTLGAKRARVRNGSLELSAAFQLQGSRGLVPLGSLEPLLSRILGGPVTLHQASRRLFIGSVAVHFTATVNRATPPAVVFNFTSPVNPMIATEPGKLHMVFTHEPLLSPASARLSFESKDIPSASYQEENGAAEITVAGKVPLMASFSHDGRTITVGPAPGAPQSAPGPAAPAPAVAAQLPGHAAPAPTLPGAASPSPSSSTPGTYFAVVDASHGGDDPGEALTNTLAEKAVTLAFADRLRLELESRGLHTLLLRQGDVNLSLDQRASLTNITRPAVYICLHASSMGEGVRLYTAVLPVGGDDNGPFLNWSTAQSSFLGLSQTVAGALAAQLQQQQIPARVLMAPLRPLNNITAPAVAVEIAPLQGGVNGLTSSDYQGTVASSLAAGLLSIRDQLGAGR